MAPSLSEVPSFPVLWPQPSNMSFPVLRPPQSTSVAPTTIPAQQQQQRTTTTTTTTTSSFSKERKAAIVKNYQVPSVKDILAFAVPAIAVWMSVPVLAMIDTCFVGLLCGTAQQAALNPAIAVGTYSSKLMAFLFSGTTAMMASAQEKDRRAQRTSSNNSNIKSSKTTATITTLIGSLQLSFWVGAGLGTSVFLFARPLLATIMGGASSDPSIMGAAMKYVQIRSLGMPAAAMLGSAQTACLFQKDIKISLYATLVAIASNIVLDMVIIRNSHAWLGGAAGAAWATTISQYVAMAFVVRWLMVGRKESRPSSSSSSSIANLDASMESNGQTANNNTNKKTTRGSLAGIMTLRDLVKLPPKNISKGFAPFVLPVITTQAGRCSASAAMDHVVSSSLTTASMAANQICTSVFYGLVPVADSLSLAAQRFVPRITQRDGSDNDKPEEQAYASKQLRKRFLKTAGLCGVILASVMGTLPLYSSVFTGDAAVRKIVNTVVPLLTVTMLKHGVFCSSEGYLLVQDRKFLGVSYGIYAFLIPLILLQLKKAALAGSSRVCLMSVFQVFLGYDIVRTVLMTGRVMWLERRRIARTGVAVLAPNVV